MLLCSVVVEKVVVAGVVPQVQPVAEEQAAAVPLVSKRLSEPLT